VEVQLGREDLMMGATAEVELQLGRGGNMEGPAGVVEVKGAAADVEKATLSNVL